MKAENTCKNLVFQRCKALIFCVFFTLYFISKYLNDWPKGSGCIYIKNLQPVMSLTIHLLCTALHLKFPPRHHNFVTICLAVCHNVHCHFNIFFLFLFIMSHRDGLLYFANVGMNKYSFSV